MVSLFIIYTTQTAACVQQLRADLQARGYTMWRPPATLSTQSVLYPRKIKEAIISSAAVIAVWEAAAAQDTEVKSQLDFAGQMYKRVLPVLLDKTAFPKLPTALAPVMPTHSQPPCQGVAALLAPHLPSPDSTDLIITISEQIAHEYIRERRKGIDRAAELLKDGIERERMLALLDYIARHDLTRTLSEKAQSVLNEDARHLPLSPSQSQHSRYIIGGAASRDISRSLISALLALCSIPSCAVWG